jgi:hypothetical protein
MFQIKKIGRWSLVSSAQSQARLFVGSFLGTILLMFWFAALVLRDAPILASIMLVMGMESERGALSLIGVILINLSILIQNSARFGSRVYLTRSAECDFMKEVSTSVMLSVIIYRILLTLSFFIVAVIFASMVFDFLA